jgi:hypothetical protein
LVYSPVMIFSLIGFLFIRRSDTKFGLFTISVFCIYFYLIASWWCWWYVGYGNRAFINLYPVLSVPLACFIQYILTKGIVLKTIIRVISLGAIILTIFQLHQMETGALHWGGMTKAAYWDSFGQAKASELFTTHLRLPDGKKGMKGIDAEYVPTFDTLRVENHTFNSTMLCDTSFAKYLQQNEAFEGAGALYVASGNEYVASYDLAVNQGSLVYITAWVKNSEDVYFVLRKDDTVSIYHDANEVYQTKGEWNKLHLYTSIPNNFTSDSVVFHIWNRGKEEFWLDELEITHLNVSYDSRDL